MYPTTPEDQQRLFDSVRGYLFRGTRPSWTFDRPYDGIGITPTTIDPLIASLFAARCRCEGEAIVLIAEKERFRGRLASPNHFADYERSIHLELTPMEFESESERLIPLAASLDFLRELGFNPPERLPDFESLRKALVDSPKMSSDQIELFARHMLEADE